MLIKNFRMFEGEKVRGISRGQNPGDIRSSIIKKILEILHKHYNEGDFEVIEDPKEYIRSISNEIYTEIEKRVGDYSKYLDISNLQESIDTEIEEETLEKVVRFGEDYYFLCTSEDDAKEVIRTLLYDGDDMKFINEIGGISEYY